MSSPPPADFYAITDQLNDEERQAREMAARFVDDKVLPIIAEAFDAHRFPVELIPEMGAHGHARLQPRRVRLRRPGQRLRTG